MSAAAVEKGLYVIDDPKVAIPDFVERLLAKLIEAPFPPIRNKLVYGESVGVYARLSVEERQHLAMWIAVQQGRTPPQRDLNLWMSQFAHTIDLQERMEHGPPLVDDPTDTPAMRERSSRMLRSGEIKVRVPEASWIGMFFERCFVQRFHIEALAPSPCVRIVVAWPMKWHRACEHDGGRMERTDAGVQCRVQRSTCAAVGGAAGDQCHPTRCRGGRAAGDALPMARRRA